MREMAGEKVDWTIGIWRVSCYRFCMLYYIIVCWYLDKIRFDLAGHTRLRLSEVLCQCVLLVLHQTISVGETDHDKRT